MATRTLKIGCSVTVKSSGKKGVIENIEKGVHKLKGSKKTYSAGDLEAEKTKPDPKKKKPINQVGDLQKQLNAIYSIIRPQFLQHNKLCRMHFEGCGHRATEVHHMNGRKNFWLIITKYMLGVCKNCHRIATKDSKRAIAAGVSVSRNTNIEYEFNKYELSLIAKQGLNAP